MQPSRKVQEARETALLLFAGLLVVAWLKADAQLYFGFVAGVIGKTGVFNWGNAKEWEAKGKAGAIAPTAPPAA